jgi:hypothetical protein
VKLAIVAAAAVAVGLYIAWPRLSRIFRGPLTPRHPVDDLMDLADATKERQVGLPSDEEMDAYMAEWGRQMRNKP